MSQCEFLSPGECLREGDGRSGMTTWDKSLGGRMVSMVWAGLGNASFRVLSCGA